MKWSELTTVKKIMSVIGLICAVAYLVLTLLDLFNVCVAPKAVGPALFGIFWMIAGFLQENKKIAIWYYLLGVAWFLLSLLRIFA